MRKLIKAAKEKQWVLDSCSLQLRHAIITVLVKN